MISPRERDPNGTIRSEKILKVKQGEELKISLFDDIRNPSSFMYAAYRQAMYAVAGIDEQSVRFHDKWNNSAGRECDLFDAMFQYSSNIIAFAGPRGSGKTSTMLSFANLLGDGRLFLPDLLQREENVDFLSGERIRALEKRIFVRLPPIAPSILEEKQNILTVVLSRLYSFASERLDRDYKISAELRNQVTKAFQGCLSGLRGVKYVDNAQNDFAMLQDVSDGMSLRVSFYHLVQSILKIVSRNGDGCGNTYLVLMLDDADSQFKVSYDVLEDIRKYLMLPNTIILISADFDMLRRLILQHYISALSNTNYNDEALRHELNKAVSKYIDKLIPPTNLIYLPKPESMLMRWGSQMKLSYVPQTPADEPEPQSLQSVILEMIYQKTGIVFASVSARPHDIIPTTLRGINQLLYLLQEMKNLPPFIPGKLKEYVSATGFMEDLAKYLEAEYLPVLDANLQRFGDYFVQDWINARILEPVDKDFLTKMECSTTAKVQVAQEYLIKKWNIDAKANNDVTVLDSMIRRLEKEHRQKEELSLFFAVKTLITLENHLWILQQKRTSLHEFLSGKRTAIQPRYFNEDTYLPRYYNEPEDWSIKESPLVFPTDEVRLLGSGEDDSRYQLLSECLYYYKDDSLWFSLLGIVTFFLRLSELGAIFNAAENDKAAAKRLCEIYLSQETALCVAANWDIWDKLSQTKIRFQFDTESAPGSDSEAVAKILQVIDSMILCEIHDHAIFKDNNCLAGAWSLVNNHISLDLKDVWIVAKTQDSTPDEPNTAGGEADPDKSSKIRQSMHNDEGQPPEEST